MIRGLYISASGMKNSMEKNNLISNNLANVNTNGYKRDIAVERTFGSQLMHRIDNNKTNVGEVDSGVYMDEVALDHSRGNFKETGNSFDWAISGEGFFTVETPGGVRYTRNGNFTLNEQRQVVTQDGYLVRGENGILQVPEGEEVMVSGNNLMVDGAIIDRIQVTSFSNKSALSKEGSSLFRSGPGVGNVFVAAGEVQQGYLEGSNVNAIEEMVKMIENNRIYESDQKAIQAQDDTLSKAVNEVGRV
ncbi:flagellar hook-basal body protein [Halonatronum saccharophilum]|uniref:flagellar hook-basal body protein n=1 Tax=Halonatronum saccharophilum TaxID=150060 RepID=UPI000489ABBE|nr:flagellar hook-basal body protein [Halonatronum saccharophilum]